MKEVQQYTHISMRTSALHTRTSELHTSAPLTRTSAPCTCTCTSARAHQPVNMHISTAQLCALAYISTLHINIVLLETLLESVIMGNTVTFIPLLQVVAETAPCKGGRMATTFH